VLTPEELDAIIKINETNQFAREQFVNQMMSKMDTDGDRMISK
jgi:hypothetical protein